VVDIIVDSPDHGTLESAVVDAGLVDALSAEGPFTVFAPTDAAFAALPAGFLDGLSTEELTDILLYHVISGAKVMSETLTDGQTATTMLNEDITVTINNDGIFINEAQVTIADIEAQNGVVHVIDAVLTPEETTSISNRMIEISEASVYPNPARDRFTVAFELSNSSNVSIEVYNIQGQMMSSADLGYRTEGLNEIEYRTDSMDNGIYILIVNTEEGLFTNKLRVVK
jgi:hypothetical protein